MTNSEVKLFFFIFLIAAAALFTKGGHRDVPLTLSLQQTATLITAEFFPNFLYVRTQAWKSFLFLKSLDCSFDLSL
jgi:hypothetical protein